MSEKIGLDDFLVKFGSAAFQTLLDQAQPIYQWACDFLKSLPLKKLDAALELVLKELANEPPAYQEKILKKIKEASGISLPLLRKIQGEGAPQRKKKDEELQGQVIILREVEPWPEAVNGAELLNDLVATFNRFIILPSHGAEAIALFVIHTYTLDAFECSPFLGFKSPTKQCGKTRALEVLIEVVNRPMPTSNITPAALFRAIETFKPTLMIDEADSFLEMNEDLRGILNSGHTRKTACVTRTVPSGDDFKVRQFSTWACKVWVMIGKPPDTVQDRSIEIVFRRKKKSETVERFRASKLQSDFLQLRQKLTRWAKDAFALLAESDPAMPEELSDRAQDCWRPLVAIANLAGGEWPKLAVEAAKALSSNASAPDDSIAILLLSDLKNYFEPEGKDPLEAAFTDDVLKHLHSMDERPWRTFDLKRGSPITPRHLANLLKPFEISSKQIRIGEVTKKGYVAKDFQDAFARYLPPFETKQAKQSNTDAGFSDFSQAKQPSDVSDEKSGENPHGSRSVSDVSDVSDQNFKIGDAWESDPHFHEKPDPLAQFTQEALRVFEGSRVISTRTTVLKPEEKTPDDVPF